MQDAICLVEDCDASVRARGLCQSHYNRYRAAGTLEEWALPPRMPDTFHRLADVNEEERTATCSVCGPVRIRIRRGRRGHECMTVRRRGAGARRAKPPRRDQRRWKYGLSAAEFDRLFERAEGRCEICGDEFEDNDSIDHCHETGLVRGILCRRCNYGLGWFNDDPARLLSALLYLKASGKSEERVAG